MYYEGSSFLHLFIYLFMYPCILGDITASTSATFMKLLTFVPDRFSWKCDKDFLEHWTNIGLANRQRIFQHVRLYVPSHCE